jgi:hypothetical protein
LLDRDEDNSISLEPCVSDFDGSFDEALDIGCAPDDLDLRHPPDRKRPSGAARRIAEICQRQALAIAAQPSVEIKSESCR